MQRRRRPVAVVGAVAIAIVAVVAPLPGVGRAGPSGSPAPAGAQAPPDLPGAGAPRPRLLYEPGTEDVLRARLDREPYRTVFLRTHQQANGWQGRDLGDLSVGAQRDLLRVAKIRAFQYALDRTVVAGQVVAFPTPDAREVAGDQARDILLQMLDRSRLAVPPPIGGWDRDISSSEEIVMAAQAYDVLVGAGYPFAEADEAEVVRRIAAATRELRLNFVDPSTAGGYASLHQNNHRTKTGAALAVAAIALADQVPDTRQWFDTGADFVDDTLRHVLLTGDGAYAEGPFYFRYLTQNLVAYLTAWDRFLGATTWTTEAGLEVPSLVDHPLLARTHRWMLDTSVPDGTMAPIDDGNPGRTHFWGAVDPSTPTTAQGYWQWSRTPQAYDVDGNITLGPDVIATYDDSITPAEPDWEPSQVYVEGGTATLRSDWSADAVTAVVLGEHDTASEFGRDRTGTGRWPQSHEHAEPGAFLLHAYGERLALDPGYLTFSTHGLVNKPQDHNVVLVDGQGPPDYLQASIAWGTSGDLSGRPPAEGQSTLSGWVASAAGDGVSVASAYRGAALDRRVLLGGDRYLVVSDAIEATDADDLTWMLHGNGGGTSGGSYERTATGGRWTIGGARLDGAIATSTGDPTLTETDTTHEVPYTVARTHTALAATAPAADGTTAAVQLLYPTRSGDAPPAVTRDAAPGGHPRLQATDAAADLVVTVVRRAGGRTDGAAAIEADGVTTDGDLLVVERATDGDLLSVWAEGATRVDEGATALLASPTPGTLARRVDGATGAVHVVAATASPTVDVGGLTAAPVDVDGACGVSTTGGRTTVALNRDRTATLLGAAAPSAPAADAGRPLRVDVGTSVALDGTASCDADGDTLTPRWELVSAPAGSAWTITGETTWHPTLAADRPGPYRVRLVVTDATGRESEQADVLVKVGPQCSDGADDDLDGLIDTDDPDCDGPPDPPPPPVDLTDAERWVTNVFRDVLGRTPDGAGLAWWAGQVDAGTSRSTLVSRLRRTAEVRARQVAAAYGSALARPPSSADVAYWSGRLAAGETLDRVVVLLLASAEARRQAGPTTRDLVALTVRRMAGREATSAELEAGEAVIADQGLGRFLRGLLRSDDVVAARVDELYASLLRRAPDPAGAAFWRARLVAGGDVVSVVMALVATSEYAALPLRPS